jgi:hypothetical protein
MTKNTIRWTALIAVLATNAVAATADPAVQPGLWEVRLVRQYMDGRDVTALVPVALAGLQQFMGGMTPQQRKQVEATFGTQVASGNTVQRMCVSPEMAAGDKPLLPANVKCQPTEFNRDGSRLIFAFNCADQGRSTTGKGVSHLASERVETRIDLVTNDANGRHTWINQSEATFIGVDCGNLKPADQVVHETEVTKKQ